jgi:phage/plasmid primase-like uncharacterized protein
MSDAVDIARTVPIENEMARRGYHLRRNGKDMVGPCPVCGGRDRFIVTPGKKLWHCRGCNDGGNVIDLVLHIDGGEFLEAVKTLTGKRPELRDNASIARMQARERERQELEAHEKAADTAFALQRWNEGVCIWDTPAQTYLASRHCDGLFPLDRDAVFRFHPACVFGGQQLPCLLSLLRNVDTDEPQAVHRTALTSDGQKIDRKMLGPKAGAAIKLWPQSAVSNRLVVGEGIETTLSAALHIKHRGSPLQPAWACVDAGNLAALPVLPGVQHLTILVDNDKSNTGQEKARECSRRWASSGRDVIRLTPNKTGIDFNDIVKG